MGKQSPEICESVVTNFLNTMVICKSNRFEHLPEILISCKLNTNNKFLIVYRGLEDKHLNTKESLITS